MKQQPDREIVDELAHLASQAEAPALDDATARRMIDAAAGAPRRAVAPRRRGFAWPIATLAFACLAAYAWFAHPPAPPAPAPALAAEPLRLTLPTGDRLVGTAGARFEIVELAPASRRLQLHTGAMVFDVAHVTADQRFSVATDHATVIATGTVFSVDASATATRVHVFEGSVAIEHDGKRDSLAANASLSSDNSESGPASITAAGEDFARERASAAPPSAPAVAIAQPAAPAADTSPRTTSASAPTTPSPVDVPRSPTATSRDAAPSGDTPPSRTAITPPGTDAPRAPRTAVTAPSVSTSIEPRPSERVATPSDLASARADIAAGRYAEALAAANAPLREGESGAWDLVKGDALRAVGRTAEAADAFESAARALAAPARLEAAYSAAYLRHHDLKDHARALVDLTGTDEPGSLFEERALVLHVDILMTLDRKNEAAAIAGRYLDRFPKGTSAKLMRALITPK
jgi:hypothetical protein